MTEGVDYVAPPLSCLHSLWQGLTNLPRLVLQSSHREELGLQLYATRLTWIYFLNVLRAEVIQINNKC